MIPVWDKTLPTIVACPDATCGGSAGPVTAEMCARLSPIQYDHINFLGRYAFSRADVAGDLRPFHDGAHESS
ncbi:hypothetical protein [Nonomuraea sp. KM90]|uniref:hypothetical protein n=1 Tax=Nonomuraea sp. KM90 TaxID=3457428 RepID=UPI003FCEA675